MVRQKKGADFVPAKSQNPHLSSAFRDIPSVFLGGRKKREMGKGGPAEQIGRNTQEKRFRRTRRQKILCSAERGQHSSGRRHK